MSIQKLFTVLTLTVAAVSCSLKETADGYVTKDSFYKTEEQCYSALRACYTPVHYIYNRPFLLATEACTDLYFCNVSAEDGILAITPARPGAAANVWLYAYKGIARANECISCIADCPLDEPVKGPMVAEARALRALYYYILTSFMGDVPFYTMPVKDIETMEEIRRLPRTSASEIRSVLYDDLKNNALPFFTDENGLRCRANEVKNQHAGYALTLMLMAKFAMWNSEWTDALYALDLLEQTYGEFSENNFPLDEIQWRYKNTDESIFEIQHAWSADGVKFYGQVASVMSPRCSGEWIYDGVYMPELARTGTNSSPVKIGKHFALYRSANNSKTENAANAQGIFEALPMTFNNETYDFSASVKRYKSIIDLGAIESGVTANGKALDRRILYKVGMGNLENGDTFETIKTGGFFYGGPQFWCPAMTATYDSNNYRIFRYADAVLMQAECYCELGLSEKSVSYLDKTRARAGLAPYQYSTDIDLMREIQNERARELGGEFHRKFDLVRWGIWYDMTRTFNEEPRVVANIRRCHQFYPIPDTECALSGGVLTNDAYNE